MSKKFSLIALAGLPNAGKSTLLNGLVGQQLAIVTPKVQTTRYNTKGIVNIEDAQLVFIDTPGLFEPNRKLETWITKAAWAGIKEAEFVCFICDAKNTNLDYLYSIKDKLRAVKKRCIAVINKIDLVKDKKELLLFSEKLKSLEIFEEIFMISALYNDGISSVIEFLKNNASTGEWLFDSDTVTDRTEREIAEEITREVLYMLLSEELPYSLEVKTDLWQEQQDGSAKIHQVIHILKESQKTIIVGKQGTKIKEIGSQARSKISSMLQRPAHLFLHVKIKPDWIERLR